MAAVVLAVDMTWLHGKKLDSVSWIPYVFNW